MTHDSRKAFLNNFNNFIHHFSSFSSFFISLLTKVGHIISKVFLIGSHYPDNKLWWVTLFEKFKKLGHIIVKDPVDINDYY